MTSNKFEQWIFNSFDVSREGLGLFRIFVSILILLFLIPGKGSEHFLFLSNLPSDFLSPPPGPMSLLDDFPSYMFFQTLHTVIIVSLIAMLIGYRTIWASIITGLSILLLQGLIFSVGKINHEIIVPLVPLLLAFSNWGNCYSVDEVQGNTGKQVSSWPLTLLALFIAFMMLTAGLPKILGGWLDPSTQAVKGHVLNQYFVKDRDALLAPFAIQVNSPILWEIADWLTILFEMSFVVALLKGKWFKFFLILAVVFHFSTQMLMNISFLPNFLAYAAFLNWEHIHQKNRNFHQRLPFVGNINLDIKAAIGFACILLVVFLNLKWLSVEDIFFPNTDLMLHEFIFITFAFLVVLYFSINYLIGKSVGKDEERGH